MSANAAAEPTATETPVARAQPYPFPAILVPVMVPTGYYPIEITQFWRGESRPRQPLPLHWSIAVRTSPMRGNTHEIVGDTDTYATQDRFDVPLRQGPDGRGSHVIGYVAPTEMDALLNRIALVPVVRHRLSWNCQNWVYEALKELKGPELYTDVAGGSVTLEALQTHMLCLLDAWEVGEI